MGLDSQFHRSLRVNGIKIEESIKTIFNQKTRKSSWIWKKLDYLPIPIMNTDSFDSILESESVKNWN